MTEKRRRSIIKTLSWRVVATLTTTVIVLIFTGELLLAISIGSLEAVSKLVLYYLHERAWARINWGKS